MYLRAPRRWRTIGRVRGAGLGGIGRRETVDCAARNVAQKRATDGAGLGGIGRRETVDCEARTTRLQKRDAQAGCTSKRVAEAGVTHGGSLFGGRGPQRLYLRRVPK